MSIGFLALLLAVSLSALWAVLEYRSAPRRRGPVRAGMPPSLMLIVMVLMLASVMLGAWTIVDYLRQPIGRCVDGATFACSDAVRPALR